MLNIFILSPKVRLVAYVKYLLSSENSDKNRTTCDTGVLNLFKSVTESSLPAMDSEKIKDFNCTSSDGVPSEPNKDCKPS